MYAEIGDLVGSEAWSTESRESREWMARRFDQNRLATERAAIIARGRAQGVHGPGADSDSGTDAVDPT